MKHIFKSIATLDARSLRQRSTIALLLIFLLSSLVYSQGLKQQVNIINPYSNEPCKGFKVVSEADGPVMVRIKIINYRSQSERFIKVSVEPGEEVCCSYPRGFPSKYSKPFIVGVWYVD